MSLVPCDEQTPGSFVVSVQNQSPIPRVIPYDSPACMDQTGLTLFPGGTRFIDIFSRRENLTTLALPTLPVGAVFQFDVTVDNPVGLPTQTVVTSLMNAEANPATDYIRIPNPATPTLKPAGFRLTDAKLGGNLAVSWTLPAFEVGSIQITSNAIVDPPPAQGPLQPPAFTLPAITCAQPSIELPTNATSATIKAGADVPGRAGDTLAILRVHHRHQRRARQEHRRLLALPVTRRPAQPESSRRSRQSWFQTSMTRVCRS